MKKLLKVFGGLLLIAFVGIQFMPPPRNQNSTVSGSDFLVLYEAPDRVDTLLRAACYDCHSDHTFYPWYTKVQPVGWYMARHIEAGKEELNFSEFANYSVRRQKSKLRSMINQIRDGEMPLKSYRLMHRDAVWTQPDQQAVLDWLEEQRNRR